MGMGQKFHKLRARIARHIPGTHFLLPTSVPIPFHHHSCPHPSRDLLVLLPGMGDRAGEFHRNGFIEALWQGGLTLDVLEVDAHFGYYARRSLLTRLHVDVIRPCRAEGYRRIWLAGISMGGLGAVLYASEHADEISGAVLIAPFLGDGELIGEIARAGGLAHWNTPPRSAQDYQRRMWRWLQGYGTLEPPQPHLFLAFGREDRFAGAQGLLAAVLPENRVFTGRGGHDWMTWRRLWRRLAAARFAET